MGPEKTYETILFSVTDEVARITLNRPKLRNAFNEVMLGELLDVLSKILAREDARVVVLTGSGTCLCAGADLNWLKRDLSYDENVKEFLHLAEVLYRIYSLPKPVVARVNGPAIGGGIGFVATCDLVVAVDTAKFSFSEVRIGVVPACISPYLVRRVGEKACREFFLTSERLTADKALSCGLVNQVVSAEDLDKAVEGRVNQLLSGGPHALSVCKGLLEKVPGMKLEDAKVYTCQVLASLREGAEAQEGMAAFLEKRKPKWRRGTTD